ATATAPGRWPSMLPIARAGPRAAAAVTTRNTCHGATPSDSPVFLEQQDRCADDHGHDCRREGGKTRPEDTGSASQRCHFRDHINHKPKNNSIKHGSAILIRAPITCGKREGD